MDARSLAQFREKYSLRKYFKRIEVITYCSGSEYQVESSRRNHQHCSEEKMMAGPAEM